MHILMIPSWYPSPQDPLNGNFIKKHINLIAEKHQVTVLNFIQFKKNEIKIKEIKINNNLTEYQLFYPKKINFLSQFLTIRKAFNSIISNIKNVDLIHGHVFLSRSYIAIWAKKYFKKPLLYSEHASYLLISNYNKLSFSKKIQLINCIKHCQRISFVSTLLKDEFHYLFPRATIFLIPNYVDHTIFKIAKIDIKNLRFIHISNGAKVKNVSEIIKAFTHLKNLDIQFEFHIILENKNEEFDACVANSSIKDNTLFSYNLSQEQIAKELQKSSALVMLSNYETFSVVMAEAWACGIPVISTRVGIGINAPHFAFEEVEFPNANSLVKSILNFIKRKDSFDKNKIAELSSLFSKVEVLKQFDEFYA